MAHFLQRLGRFSFRRRKIVLAIWLGILVLSGVGAATLSGPTTDSFSIPGTDSQQASDLLSERFPQAAADGATARVVFHAPDGATLTDPGQQAVVNRLVADLGTGDQVATVTDPYTTDRISDDGSVGYAQVSYAVPAYELSDEAHASMTAATDAARNAGLTVATGGDAVEETGASAATEALGLAVAAVVLLITLGSIVAAGLPLLLAVAGVGVAVAAVTAASGFVDLSSNTSTLALMLGLAVAIDYSLFILSRYRQELSEGRDHHDAVGRAVATAGSAVVFAGLTVVIALVGLVVVGIPFLTEMGVAAGFAVVIAVLIALTLLPAILGFAGNRVLSRRDRPGREAHADAKPRRRSAGHRWASTVTRRPALVLVAAAVGLGAVALPAAGLTLGLPDDGTAPPATSQREAYDMLTGSFGAGYNGPLVVVLDGASAGAATGAVDMPTAAAEAAELIRGLADVATVSAPSLNPAGDTAVVTVVPNSGPSSTETADLVAAIREMPAPTGTDVAVTGQTAAAVDVTDKLGAALVPYLAVVVGLALVLLCLVFRSVLIPLKATAGFLLTVAATLGAVVAVFQWGWFDWLFGIEGQTGPIMSLLPILITGVVFGLAMDYQVFLVTRMREEHAHGAEPKAAIVTGFSHSARVVAAAAVIMISVFAGFILAPESLIKQLGFGLAFGVAIDAFVVRMTIVPAAMALLGRSAWWLPRWLERLLPNIDVEGSRLADHRTPSLDTDTETDSTLPTAAASPGATRAEPADVPAQGSPSQGSQSQGSRVPATHFANR